MALSLPLAFWLALVAAAGVLLGLAVWRRLHWLPAWPLRVALVGIALLAAFYPRIQARQAESTVEKQVLVVDFSDSVLPAERARLAQSAADWQKAQPGRVVVGAAADSIPLLDPVSQATQLDGRASDLTGGLALAANLIGDQPGRIYLATDGLAASPARVQAAIQQLTAGGKQVELLQLQGRDRANDGYLGAIQAPANLWENTPFDVLVPVSLPQGGSLAKLELTVNGVISALQARAQKDGMYSFQLPPQPKGIVTLQVTADFRLASGDADAFQDNNQAYATLQIFASPRALFVTYAPQRDAHQIATLKSTGLTFDVLAPAQLSTSLEALQKYKVILLSNFLAGQLSDEQMISLQVFVANQAGGLIFLGGRNSYTLGGYKNSLLEPLLPVKLEPPPRPSRPPVVFLLIMDGSASMGQEFKGSTAPLTLAKEAAMRAVETLKAQDYIGMQVFSDESTWTPHIRQLGDGLDLRSVLDQISALRPGFGTRMYQAMQGALDEMLKLPSTAPAARHVLVLSDGISEDGKLDEYAALARRFYQEAHATVSTIALGVDVDKNIMQTIASEGKGRFYAVSTANELPKIMIAESEAGRGENIQSGDTVLKAGIPDHPLLSGLSEQDLPHLAGYNALSSKKEEGAEDILVSSEFSDPLLASWQYGLGRVTAWMGDAGQEWTGKWPDAGRETNFWLQVIRYSLPNPAIGPSQAGVQVSDTALQISAHLQSGGVPLDLAQVVISYVDGSGKLQSLSIPQTAAGMYALSAPRPAPGAYRAALTYTDGTGSRQEIALPFAVNAPAEWQPAEPGAGATNLAAWSKAGGARLVDITALQAASSQTTPGGAAAGENEDWLKYILLALAVLWPLEIALRRRWLSWSKV